MTKAYIPNCITAMRLGGTAVLPFLEPLSAGFYGVYTFCGITDILDGWTARKLKAANELGARLDSIADLLFYAVMLLRLFPILWRTMPSSIWYAVGTVLLLRLFSYGAAAVKYRRFAALHTYLNKLTGALVFAIPYSLRFSFAAAFCRIVCLVAIFATVEELLMHLRGGEYDGSVKSLHQQLAREKRSSP